MSKGLFVQKAPERAPSGSKTSDLSRPRSLAIIAIACAAGVAAAVAIHRPVQSPGPVGLPHREAKLACAQCHDSVGGAQKACGNCHDATLHASARPAHKKLQQEGTLRCTDCHAAHGEGQAVTFRGDGTFVRSGAGNSISGKTDTSLHTTVPLVPMSACVRCHDLSSGSRDVATRCGTTADLCMDEHAGAKKDRFIAWDAAKRVAKTTSWVQAPPQSHTPPFEWLAGGFIAAIGSTVMLRTRRRVRKGLEDKPAARARRLPVIDPSTCLGCNACVEACPFDVLSMEKFIARVARPEECCGAVLCAEVCPNGSLSIADDTTAPPPLTDDRLESTDVPGIYLAGDVTGVPLIKNAIAQGVAAASNAVGSLPKKRDKSAIDVVIIGAGPAGIAAALRCKELGASSVTLEQATVASNIQSFPRNKIIFDQPLTLPAHGELWLKDGTKEELLSHWARVVRKHVLDIREQERVTAIDKEGDMFKVVSSAGTVIAHRIVIAIGRRGSPRALDVPIASDATGRVSYSLSDVASFGGQKVLVIGLGDSAMEAAIALCQQPGTAVAITYRRSEFHRGRKRNIDQIRSLAATGRISLLMGTTLIAIERNHVVLRRSDGEVQTLETDAVLAMIGGSASGALLETAGIRPRRKNYPTEKP